MKNFYKKCGHMVIMGSTLNTSTAQNTLNKYCPDCEVRMKSESIEKQRGQKKNGNK